MKFYASIQVLRGLAALGVVLFHVSDMLHRYSDGGGMFCRLSSFWFTGAAGVDLFFIISGFVMVQSTASIAGQPGAGKQFLVRRSIRIMPLYWLFSGIMLLLVLLPSTLSGQFFSLEYTVKSFLFIPALNPVSGLDLPLLPQGWTLSYEVYFYLLIGLLLCFPQRIIFPLITLFFLVSIAGGVVLGGLVFLHEYPLLKVVTSPLLLEFILGSLLAWFMGKTNRQPGKSVWPGMLLLSGGLGLLYFSTFLQQNIVVPYRVIFWGLPMLAVAGGAVILERYTKRSWYAPCLQHMGDSSYATYLSHIFVILALSTLLKKGFIPQLLCNDLLAVITVILCLMVGSLTRLYPERYLSEMVSGKISGKS